MSMVLAVHDGILSPLGATGFLPESHQEMIFSDFLQFSKLDTHAHSAFRIGVSIQLQQRLFFYSQCS